jgi:hypothetical protein
MLMGIKMVGRNGFWTQVPDIAGRDDGKAGRYESAPCIDRSDCGRDGDSIACTPHSGVPCYERGVLKSDRCSRVVRVCISTLENLGYRFYLCVIFLPPRLHSALCFGTI